VTIDIATAPLLEDLTEAQREAVVYDRGPLLIIAGAGTGKTTVITRRIAWLIASKQARADEILALTFTDKAAQEMEERVDLLVPYGYLDVSVSTFHAFGDSLLREHALDVGFSPDFRVLSRTEQVVFLRRHVFELPLERFRPLHDPTRYLDALVSLCARAKDEAVTPEEFAEGVRGDEPMAELAGAYAAYQELLRANDAVDFGDQVLLAVRLLEAHPEIQRAVQARFRYIMVDEFQDTNFAQYRLLELLAGPTAQVTVVGDDDQSIYKWRGAAISNVLKFLEHYQRVHTVVLKENFRSGQALLDCAYRLIRFNDPDRLEVHRGIEKRLVAHGERSGPPPSFRVFDTVSSEADWVAETIREGISAGRRPSEFAVLVRSNREADSFLRALNVAGLPWEFSGASGLMHRPESKMLMSCLKALAEPDDSLSWYHVASSSLYTCPMEDLVALLAAGRRANQSLRQILLELEGGTAAAETISQPGRERLKELVRDIGRLLELSRTCSAGQLLYRWLSDRGYLARLTRADDADAVAEVQTIGRFFDQLRRLERLGGGTLPELIQHLELFRALGNDPLQEDDALAERVRVMTLHKAKGLEFSTVFMVGLVHGRFPTPRRRDPIELPEALIKDVLPIGDYHLQEERRLFYVGMTRARDALYLTCAYDYGGKTARKASQFVLEALDLPSASAASGARPAAKRSTPRELIERSAIVTPVRVPKLPRPPGPLRLDSQGLDDYATCPLKYRYSKVLRIPVLRHHLVVYGAALHKAVEVFFKTRLAGRSMTEEELVGVFERSWHSEGFLTREHEERRLEQGRDVLRRFVTQQQERPERPTMIEQKFALRIEDVLLVGRWDRVDCRDDGAVIIDYKSSEVSDQAVADKRARESIQMQVYALAWEILHGSAPARVELRYLDTGITGTAQFDSEDLERCRELILTAAKGIVAEQFQARPQEFACRWCAFQGICPSAFQFG